MPVRGQRGHAEAVPLGAAPLLPLAAHGLGSPRRHDPLWVTTGAPASPPLCSALRISLRIRKLALSLRSSILWNVLYSTVQCVRLFACACQIAASFFDCNVSTYVVDILVCCSSASPAPLAKFIQATHTHMLVTRWDLDILIVSSNCRLDALSSSVEVPAIQRQAAVFSALREPSAFRERQAELSVSDCILVLVTRTVYSQCTCALLPNFPHAFSYFTLQYLSVALNQALGGFIIVPYSRTAPICNAAQRKKRINVFWSRILDLLCATRCLRVAFSA